MPALNLSSKRNQKSPKSDLQLQKLVVKSFAELNLSITYLATRGYTISSIKDKDKIQRVTIL